MHISFHRVIQSKVKHAIGYAKAQVKIRDPRPGGGKQILFGEFNTDWITEVRNIPNQKQVGVL